MHNGAMANGDVLPDQHGFARIAMENGAVLHIAALADED
jgi:hypothetical protein